MLANIKAGKAASKPLSVGDQLYLSRPAKIRKIRMPAPLRPKNVQYDAGKVYCDLREEQRRYEIPKPAKHLASLLQMPKPLLVSCG